MKVNAFQNTAIQGLTICWFLLYGLGYCFPDLFWGTHFLAFLPSLQQGGILFFALLLFGLQFLPNRLPLTSTVPIKPPIFLLVSILFMALIWAYPVVDSFYGDAFKYLNIKSKAVPFIPEGTHEAFFSFSLDGGAGEQTILAVVTYIAYFFNMTYFEAFNLMNAVFGGLFAFVWLFFVNRQLSFLIPKIILALAGLAAPFVLFFLGHMEIYAPIYLLNLLWIVLAVLFVDQLSWKKLTLLAGLLIVAMKAHSIALLLAPILAYLFVHHFYKQSLSWRKVSYFILIPITLAGLVLYFFYFGDHIDDRSFRNGRVYSNEHLFLPLFSPEPPLDRYNLLSFNHLWDYFNLHLCWSPVALMIMSTVTLSKKRKKAWNQPSVIIAATALALYAALFFVVNPLISMPRDWDLFMLPTIPLLVLSCLLLKEMEKDFLTSQFLFNSLAVIVLTLSIFPIHYHRDALADRLESIAFRSFTTYYAFSSETVGLAILCRNSGKSDVKGIDHLIDKFRPYAQKGIDYEFGNILIEQGKFHQDRKEFDLALARYKEARTYFDGLKELPLRKTEVYFRQGLFKEAFEQAKILTQRGYPSPKEAHRIALQCALEAESYEEALLISTYYVQHWTGDFIEGVHEGLVAGENLSQLKSAFLP